MIVCKRSKIGFSLAVLLLFGSVAAVSDGLGTQQEQTPVIKTEARFVLELAATRALDRLARPGGFYLDQQYHIPLPPELDDAVSVLKANYSLALADALERSINRAAENAIAIGREKILKAVQGQHPAMAHDGKSASSATDALRATLEPQLVSALRPELGISLDIAATRATAATVARRYATVARAPFPTVDYERYLATELVHRFFDAMAREENAIQVFSAPRSAAAGGSAVR